MTLLLFQNKNKSTYFDPIIPLKNIFLNNGCSQIFTYKDGCFLQGY